MTDERPLVAATPPKVDGIRDDAQDAGCWYVNATWVWRP